jgi:hypothetical protein
LYQPPQFYGYLKGSPDESKLAVTVGGNVLFMIHDAIEIYNKDAPAWLKVGVTNNDVGMVCRF